MSLEKKYNLKIRTRIMLLYLGLSIVLIGITIPGMFYVISKTLNDSLESVISETINEVEKNISLKESTIQIQNIKSIEEKLLRNGEIFVLVECPGNEDIYLGYGAEEAFEWSKEEKAWKKKTKDIKVDNKEISITVIGNVYYNNTLDKVLTTLIWLIPVYLIITALFTYFMAKTMLNPISRIINITKEIKNGKWESRIKGINTNDEIGELAEAFNEMISEIDDSYSREKRFTSDASHELRTPISVVSACADEALSTNDKSIIKENLETIQVESGRMNTIISQLLTLSRGYEGRYSFECEEIGLRDSLESVTDIFADDLAQKQITVHNNISSETHLYADQGMYTQILINVISNAIKYGKRGGNIWLNSDEKDSYLWLIVKDDGIGIAEEDIPHLFDRFFRADSSRNRDGSGLGLSIVKWMVDVHRGQINVESELNKGTTIRIGIPLNKGKTAGLYTEK